MGLQEWAGPCDVRDAVERRARWEQAPSEPCSVTGSGRAKDGMGRGRLREESLGGRGRGLCEVGRGRLEEEPLGGEAAVGGAARRSVNGPARTRERRGWAGPEPEEGRAGRSNRPPLVSALRSGSEPTRRAQALGFLSSGGVGAMGETERPTAARPEEDEVKVAVTPSSAAERVRPGLRVLARLRSPDRRRRRPGAAGRKRPRCRLVGEGHGHRSRSGLSRDGGCPGLSCSGTLAGAAAALPSAAEERVCRCMRGQMTGGAALGSERAATESSGRLFLHRE